MLIGGLQKFTLSDFPNTPAAIIFTQGCNFNCPYCHNDQLIPLGSDQLISTEFVLEFLKEKISKLRGVVITGGEPTIQSDLETILEQIKNLGYKTKLDTNGSNPQLLKKLIEGRLIDFVAMDIKAPWHKYDLLCGKEINLLAVQKSVEVIKETKIDHLFRTTVFEEHLKPADIEIIKEEISRNSPYKTQVCNL